MSEKERYFVCLRVLKQVQKWFSVRECLGVSVGVCVRERGIL